MSYLTCVSICTYNGEKYIEEQLKSIINQTVKPDQIVISDDCSTDNTVGIATKVLKESGINYFINVNKTNMGITENGTFCTQFCKGDLFLIADQDNVWDKRFIESFLKKFNSDKTLQYVFCNGYVTDEMLQVIKPEYDDAFFEKSKHQFLIDAISKRGFPHGHTVGAKLDFIRSITPYLFAGDEWIAICAAATGNIGSINEKLVYFRRHDSSFSSSEGGGKKLGLFTRIKKSTFDEYFIWPDCQYKAYKRYLELYQNVLDDEAKDIVEKHMLFEGELYGLKTLGRIDGLKRLRSIYKMEEYKLYRGNRNTYISDSIFLILHSCHA